MDDKTSRLKTNVLWQRLFSAASVDSYFQKNQSEIDPPTFDEMIRELCKQRNEPAERVILRAGIERSFGHALFRGDRKPSRDTVLQLAFGFGADVELTQTLLKRAQHSTLHPRVRRDVVISYALMHGKSFEAAQCSLSDYGLPLLGGTRK